MASEIFPGATLSAVSFVMSFFGIMRLACAVPAGMVSNRFGEKFTYVLGLSLCAISSALIGFSRNYWELLIYRGFGGIGSVMFTVSVMSLVIKISPVQMRGRVSALYAGAFLLGNVVGPLFGGLLAGFGQRAPFLVYAAILFLAGVLVALLLPDDTDGKQQQGENQPVMGLGEALAQRSFTVNLVGLFGHGWANYGARFILVPLFVVGVLKAEPWVAGIALGAYAIGNALILPAAAFFADLVGRKQLIIAGLALSGVGMALMLLAVNPIALCLLCFISGVGSGAANPASNAVIADVVGVERSGGKVIALTQMVTDVGAILGSIAAGVLTDLYGYSAAFVLSGALLVVGSLSWIGSPDTLAQAKAGARQLSNG